jgi:hypothetical protein
MGEEEGPAGWAPGNPHPPTQHLSHANLSHKVAPSGKAHWHVLRCLMSVAGRFKVAIMVAIMVVFRVLQRRDVALSRGP